MSGEVHGKSTRVHIAGYDLTRYLRSAETTETMEAVDATTFGQDARSYLPSPIEDGTFSSEGLYSSADGAVRDAILAAASAGDALIACWPDTDAIGKPGDGLAGIQTARSVSTDIGDLALVSMEFQSTLGVEHLVSLHAMGAEEAATDEAYTSVDGAAQSTDGAAGYLQVAAAGAGVTLDVKIQDSSDGETWVDLITFTQVAGAADFTPAFERLTVAGTVERYLRAIATIAGGAATFAVAATRSPVNT